MTDSKHQQLWNETRPMGTREMACLVSRGLELSSEGSCSSALVTRGFPDLCTSHPLSDLHPRGGSTWKQVNVEERGKVGGHLAGATGGFLDASVTSGRATGPEARGSGLHPGLWH